ncbi:hypothetical protein LWI29_036995 [Acer saccharum]|uniref:Uncharacterized protein n=1 Tax=Acer saccharum TaxID=4024 RepID=A0AA39S240_ACESA|nr:hypothetical protein LWI29_036995 [Acer saccharum]
MSGDDPISISSHSESDNDLGNGSDEGVESGARSVDRRVTVRDPSEIVNINVRDILDRGGVLAIAMPVEFPQRRNDAEASTSDRPTGVLDGNPASLIAQENLDGLRTMYDIPKSVELRAPLGRERADWDIPEWTCFYEYTLRLGFRFSVPELVRRLLKYFDIAPGQLMPNSWRILLSLTVLQERHNIRFGLGCVLHNYYLKEHVGD